MLVIKIIGALLWIKSGEVSNLLSLYICIYCTKCLDLLVKGIFPHSSANFLYGWKKLYNRHIHSKKFNFYTPVPAPRRVRFQNSTTETILTTQRAYLKFRERNGFDKHQNLPCPQILLYFKWNITTLYRFQNSFIFFVISTRFSFIVG